MNNDNDNDNYSTYEKIRFENEESLRSEEEVRRFYLKCE